jgi:ADP-ribose pyrophosphatase YjhB (NUDIX family)
LVLVYVVNKKLLKGDATGFRMIKKLPYKEFKEIYSKVPLLCVDLLIENSEGFLLTKRAIDPWKGLWHFPGGTVLFGETLNECARRVAKKELGIEIEPKGFVDVLEYSIKETEEPSRQAISLVFHATLKSGKIVLDEQSEEYGFFRKELPEGVISTVKEFFKEKL